MNNFFSSSPEAYKNFRPTYPKTLYEYLANLSPAKDLVWDCGCGNGQASVALAEHFKQVQATDVSAEQISEAQVADNIRYSVCPAEKIEAADNSIDLITVAQAIHWFDHPVFFKEADRVLKPKGIIAAWGYQLINSNPMLDAIIEELHTDLVGPFWPKGRELLDEGYTKIPFLYPRLETPAFKMQCHWQLQQLMGYLNTWSAVKAYQQKHGENPVEIMQDEIIRAWGDVDRSRDVYWPLILYVGQKPG